MKKRLVLELLLLVCLVFLVVCLVFLVVVRHQPAGPVGRLPSRTLGGGEIVLNCPIPTVPAEVPNLKVVEHDITPTLIVEVGEGLFGFSGDIEEISDGLGLWMGRPGDLSNPSRELWMFNSGAIHYISGKDHPRYVPNSLPSYDQAREIAENFIQTIKDRGLTPRDPHIRITFSSIGPGAVSVRKEENIVHYLSVQFELKFDELRIGGPGGKVSVLVGENGEIVGFRGFWRDVERDGNILIRVTPEEALEKLKTGLQVKKAIIENIMLGYYSVPILERQETLWPAYFFQLASEDGMFRWTEAILAIDKEVKPSI